MRQGKGLEASPAGLQKLETTFQQNAGTARRLEHHNTASTGFVSTTPFTARASVESSVTSASA